MIEEKNDLMKNIGGDSDNNLRKYLILGGGVFVLFVVGIVISKFMFSEPKKNDTAVILPPEVEKVQKKEDTALFNDIPVENEFKKPEVQTPDTEVVEKKTQQPIEEVKPVETEEIKSTPVEKTEPKQVEKPKVVQQKKSAPAKKVVQKYNYYIQVAAITRGEPSKKFLALIKKNGFNYKIVEVNVKGMKVKRVLVGGFISYKEAKNNLVKVRKNISSSAFIKRLK